MPSSRAVLIDIATAGADLAMPHAVIGASGRLRFTEPSGTELAPCVEPSTPLVPVSLEPALISPDAVPKEILPATVAATDTSTQPSRRGFGKKKKDAVADQATVAPALSAEPQLA